MHSLSDKKIKILAHFTKVAPRYDLMNTILSLGLHHRWKREAVKMLGLRQGERVLDLCGGTGDLALLAANQVGPEGRVILYDLNRAMLLAGRPKLALPGLGDKVFPVEGDAEVLALASESLDAVVMGFGLRNLIRREESLREIHRVLRPGGRLVILEFSRPPHPWFRRLYDVYSHALMPLLGGLIAGSRAAYTYLITSIREFPLPEEVARLLARAGFSHPTFRPLTQGIAVIHVGVKPKRP
jgi:demethylmenaquinone methyltransferase/2-methoxy-6-polyprenyl-1,4-benzoquinol methylase